MKLILGAMLAGLVSFAWGYLSWMVLGWHSHSTFGFKNEAEVSEVLLKNAASGHGRYVLPHLPEVPSFLSEAEKEQKRQAVARARDQGPFMIATVRPGKKPFLQGQAMALSYGRGVLGGLILGGLLSVTAFPYLGKVTVCGAAGLFAALAVEVPNWIWFETQATDLLVNLADPFFEWTAVGLVLAAFTGRPQVMER
jgi:hypothetical protein